ncbi:MAG: homoserine O-succinyltransferase [Eubacterium sp.]|nr:homoserine O-succinyltransferase [Candidatus Colimonas fimequi]
MPLLIPNELPAAETLQNENIFTMDLNRATSQSIRPLRIVIVNLMPTKIATETQLARVLANSPLQVELTLVTMSSHESTHVSQDHMDTFYKTIDDIKHEYFDGMILTGAPVEKMPFEQVDYWPEISGIFEWAKTHVYSSMFICWGAQAALYYYYGIDKYITDAKIFGVFEHKIVRPRNPLVRGFDDTYFAPHSRHTAIKREDIENCEALRVLADSPEVGPNIMSTENGRQIFLMGHHEYDKGTLASEYYRDRDAGMDTAIPKNYFKNDDPDDEIMFRWRGHANLLFSNWLNYYVYQGTPYDLKELDNK